MDERICSASVGSKPVSYISSDAVEDNIGIGFAEVIEVILTSSESTVCESFQQLERRLLFT